MAFLPKKYVFKASPTNDTGSEWKWEFYTYRGRFGRFEAWSPLLPNAEQIPKDKWNIPGGYGPLDYYINVVTVDGTIVFSQTIRGNTRHESVIEISRDNQLRVGEAVLKLDTTKITVNKDSDVFMTIVSAQNWIPWIQYKDRPQFAYNENRGMIDPDGVPAKIIEVAHDVYERDIFTSAPSFGFMPTLIALMVQASILALNAANDILFTGKSWLRIYTSDDETGSAFFDDAFQLLPDKKAPRPAFGYKYESSWINIEDPTSGGALRIISPGNVRTMEYASLKYQDFDTILDLEKLLPYTFLYYGEAYHSNIGDKTKGRLDKADTPIQVNLDYRTDFVTKQDDKKYVSWLDRLRALSRTNGTSIFKPELRASQPAPKEYKEGIKDEYHWLNSKIKVGKLVRIKRTYLKQRKVITTVEGQFGNDNVTGYYQTDNFSLEAATQEYKDAFENFKAEYERLKAKYPGLISGVEGYADSFEKNKVYVLVEPNAAIDTESIAGNKLYTVTGKLVNVAWLQSLKGVFNSGKLVDEQNFWNMYNISVNTAFFLKNWDDDPIHTWFIIVRGKGDENHSEEFALKDIAYDYIAENIPSNAPADNNPCGPKNYTVSTTGNLTSVATFPITENGPLPLISLCGYLGGPANMPIEVIVRQSEKKEPSEADWYELYRVLMMPDRSTFHYHFDHLMVCPLVPVNDPPQSGEYMVQDLHIGYPEGGYSRNVTYNNITFPLPKPQFDLAPDYTSGFPTSKSYLFQVLKSGRVFEHNPDLSQPGWTPLVEGGKLIGIRLNQAYDANAFADKYFIRCINIGGIGKEDNRTPIKRAMTLQIEYRKPTADAFNMEISVNRHRDVNLYNLEPVGYVYMNSSGSDWYQELVPGKGVKTLTGDHGAYFAYATASGAEDGRANAIQGQFKIPAIIVDAYEENSRSGPEGAEANGISEIKRGGELEMFSTLKDAGILRLWTRTQTYSVARKAETRLHVFYDSRRQEAFLLFGDSQGRLKYKRASFQWAEVHQYRRLWGALEDNIGAISFSYYNDKLERYIYFGKPQKNTSAIVSRKLSSATPQKFFTRDNVERSLNLPGAEIKLSNSSNLYIVRLNIQATLTASNFYDTNWFNTAAAKIQYSRREDPSTFIDYGYIRHDGTVEPTYFFIAGNESGKPSELHLDCSMIENPDSIRVQLIVPHGLTDAEFESYKEVVQSVSFNLESINVETITDSQFAEGSSATGFRNGLDETYIAYNAANLFDENGAFIDRSIYGDLETTQLIYSNDLGATWRYPRMNINEVQARTNNTVTEEKKSLTDAGLTTQQANAIVKNNVSWDRPMVLGTLGTSSLVYDSKSQMAFHFGFTTSTADAGRGSLAANPLPVQDFNKNWSVNAADKVVGFSGPTIKSENMVNSNTTARVAARNIEKQTVNPVMTKTDMLVIFYVDEDNFTLRSKVSNDQGVTWTATGLQMFRNTAYFNNVKNVYILPNPQTETFFFFGMVPIDESESAYQLCCMTVPMHYFDPTLPPEIVASHQQTIDTTVKTLVVGNPENTLPNDTTTTGVKKTIVGNAIKRDNVWSGLPPHTRFGVPSWISVPSSKLDSNILSPHFITGYIEAAGRTRIFYINELGNIASKVSDDNGQTWKLDEVV